MEDINREWNKLTLSEREEKDIDHLGKQKPEREYILAAKFLSRRVLNIENVSRAFRPLWRTRKGFRIRKAGEHTLLFVFDSKDDAENVVMCEPWSFDNHLVLFQRYDDDIPLNNLKFNTATFWVQIHNLPVRYMNYEVAEGIGETLGTVVKLEDKTKMEGGSFMRVRVVIDISQPLCRCRKIILSEGSVWWVSLKYERLRSICYWCGLVSHEDKDCELWIKSKGTLTVDKQQFGPWICAPQFNPSRKTFVEVRGYYDEIEENKEMKPLITYGDGVDVVAPAAVSDADAAGIVVAAAASGSHVPVMENTEISGLTNQFQKLSANLAETDKAISGEFIVADSKAGFSNLNSVGVDIQRVAGENGKEINKDGGFQLGWWNVETKKATDSLRIAGKGKSITKQNNYKKRHRVTWTPCAKN